MADLESDDAIAPLNVANYLKIPNWTGQIWAECDRIEAHPSKISEMW
ncbi:MAG: hypothetical protein AB4042_08275 [Leptolyngbyaceae cyanobacterium]